MTQSITLNVNAQDEVVDVEPTTPLLWVLREQLKTKLTGAKYGCGAAYCGACTVHVDGKPVRSCVLPVADVGSAKIVTIEGLGDNAATLRDPVAMAALSYDQKMGLLHGLQRAWVEQNVPQCGYCQPGQIMAAAALCTAKPQPTDADIDLAMSGNLCRCGTYPRIKRAIKAFTKQL